VLEEDPGGGRGEVGEARDSRSGRLWLREASIDAVSKKSFVFI